MTTTEQEHVVNFTLNGRPTSLRAQRAWTLLYTLRDVLGLTGTKYGCGTADCGACKVLIDGKPRNSCAIPMFKVEGREVVTVEGLQENGQLSLLQQAFNHAGAIQCGFCTPGMIITATALLAENPTPSELEIREAYSNNLCRCTGYVKIVEAVQMASLGMARARRVESVTGDEGRGDA